MASVTWYDLLGVERDATPEQIRVAWREATDRAEPGTSQFKKYNEAAEVLLDARARSAYDAELAASEPAPEPAPEGEPDPGPEPAAEPVAEPTTTTDTTSGVARWASPLASTGVTVAVALVTVLAVAVGGYFWFGTTGTTSRSTPGRRPRPPPSGRCRSCSPTTTASSRPTRRGRCAT